MTIETDELKKEIDSLRSSQTDKVSSLTGIQGYTVAITILTDLLGSIFIGCAIGLFLQYVFKTSVLLTAGLTLLGGVAGLYSTIKYAILLEKKGQK